MVTLIPISLVPGRRAAQGPFSKKTLSARRTLSVRLPFGTKEIPYELRALLRLALFPGV